MSDQRVCLSSLKTLELESLLLGLDRRLAELQEDVAMLEREDDGELYGVVSLQVIENELKDIKQLIDKLNSTTVEDQHLTMTATKQVDSPNMLLTRVNTNEGNTCVQTLNMLLMLI